jgi:hypothetical protein
MISEDCRVVSSVWKESGVLVGGGMKGNKIEVEDLNRAGEMW